MNKNCIDLFILVLIWFYYIWSVSDGFDFVDVCQFNNQTNSRIWDQISLVPQMVRLVRFHCILQDVIGSVCRGRRGLGNYGKVQWSKKQRKPKRDMIVQQVKKEAEQTRMTKAVSMSHQGNWTRWETVDQRSLSWKDLWSMDQGKLSFLLRAVVDLLPTTSNLRPGVLKWMQDALCAQPATAH